MDLKECLEILGLKNATSQKQVKEAYRNMVRTWHPDRFPFDAELRKHAEEKLRNINLAYELLTTHLTSKHQEDIKAWHQRKPDADSKIAKQPEKAGPYTRPASSKSPTGKAPGKPRRRPTMRPSASAPAKTSSAGKYVVFGLLLLLAGFTVFIINYLLDLDQSRLSDRTPASTMMKKLTGESESSKPAQTPVPRGQDSVSSGYSKNSSSDSGLSNRQIKYYEIYLKEGGVIIAEHWWEQGDMIMYKTKFGTLGIEKDSVKNIISR